MKKRLIGFLLILIFIIFIGEIDFIYFDCNISEYSFNNPPNKPLITGPTNGNLGILYEYEFNSIDPDGDDLYYIVHWGDSFVQKIGPCNSSEEILLKHCWYSINDPIYTYIIEAQARDIHDMSSEWAKLEVNMPKSYAINMSLLDNHPYLIPIIRKLFNMF